MDNQYQLTNEEILKLWEKDLKLFKKSSRTIKTYLSQLNSFSQTVNKHFFEIDRNDIKQFCFSGSENANTIINKQADLKTFYNWLKKEKYIQELPINDGEWWGIEKPKRKPKHLTDEQIFTVVNFLKNSLGFKRNLRDYTIFQILYMTALRREELTKIKVKDFDFNKGVLRVIGKGDKEREVPFKQSLNKIIYDYIIKNNINENGYLFPSNKSESGHVSVESINWLFSKIEKKTGIDIHPHALRSTWATNMLNGSDKGEGMPITSIQMALGHEDLKTTQIYAQTSIEKLKKDVEMYGVDAIV